MNLLSSLLKYTADQIAALRAKDTSQDTTVSGINSRLITAEGDIDSLEAQFTTVVSAVTTDTEVTNVRVGDNGVTYDTAGNAVRKQLSDVKSALNVADADILSIFVNGNTVFDPSSFVAGAVSLVNGSIGYDTPPCAPILDKHATMVKLFSDKVKVTVVNGYKIRGAIYNADGTFSEAFNWISDASSYPSSFQNKKGKFVRAYAMKTDGSNLSQADYDALTSVYSIECEDVAKNSTLANATFGERTQTSGNYTDFNSITKNGAYLVNSTLANGFNGETTYQGLLNVFTWDASNGFGSMQMFQAWDGEIYARAKWSNAWTSWIHITDRTTLFAERTQTASNFTDFDAITTIGAYLVNSSLQNGYEGASAKEYRGSLLVFHWSDGNGYGLIQIYCDNEPNRLYFRNQWGGTWNKWNAIITSENIKLYGAKIANFGDSIFGNKRPPNDVSTALAKLTGATVYNLGFGGCRMSKNDANWDAFSMYRLAYAVANNDYSVQNAVDISASGLPSYFTQTRTLLESLDFDEIDVVTISYGTNDFTAGVPLSNNSNPYDTETFEGALRYSLELLLSAYPQLKIFVCTPTYRFWMENGAFVDDSDTRIVANQKLTDFVESSIAVAKEYHLTPIDNYYELGINKFNRSHWFPADDGTHHNQLGAVLIAQHMANEMF